MILRGNCCVICLRTEAVLFRNPNAPIKTARRIIRDLRQPLAIPGAICTPELCGAAPECDQNAGSFLFRKARRVDQKRYHTKKTQEIPGFFACLGVQKVQGFSVDTKPPFFQSCRTRTCVNPNLGAIRASDQKIFFTDFGGTPPPETTKY